MRVIDEQTIYDPQAPDDKLLLDLKGTMSEAELHWLGLRLTGARRHKARRGALRLPAPTGYVWREGGLALDTDEAVVQAIRVLFERFRVEPSVWSLLRWARAAGLEVPTRRTWADGTSEVQWKPVGASRLYHVLHDPIYAGAYVYGRSRHREQIVDGQVRRVRYLERDPDKWLVVNQGAHPGYLTWEEYLENQEKLRHNLSRMANPRMSAPREGPALLCGLLVCCRCGRRMSAHYSGRGRSYFTYSCTGERDRGQVLCWTVPGAAIDAAVEELFLQTMVPEELELSLAVEREVEGRAEELAQAFRARMEQAAYEARRAERRYKAVDPDNRVVARTLEREWEEKLQAVAELEQQYARARKERRVELSEEDRRRIRALGRDLPQVWRAPTTTVADRKAMLRMVIEAIALHPVEVPRRVTEVKVQWQGGQVTELEVPRPSRRQCMRTGELAVARLRELAAAGLRDDEIAVRLNGGGYVTGRGKSWTEWAVQWARRKEGIERVAPDRARGRPLPDRHPDGRYSVAGAAQRFGVSVQVVRGWIRRGLVAAQRERYAGYPGVWWIVIDEAAATRLEQLTRRPRES